MISLRYHIVSLVAVFLALALGIVVGSTVLQEGTVSVLRATGEQVRQQSEKNSRENVELKKEQARLQSFGAAFLPELIQGRLKGRPVVLVDTDKVDNGLRDTVRKVLEDAGAEVDGQVTLSDQHLALANEADRTAVGRLLGADAGAPEALRDTLVKRLADRLVTSSAIPQEDGQRPSDLLTGLQDADFLDLNLSKPITAGTGPFPRQGSSFVLLGPSPAAAPTAVAPDAFLVPLADQVSSRASGGAVAGVEAAAVPGPNSWVQALRNDREVSRRVSGIDSVDTVYGQFSLVEALQTSLQQGPAGQYGTKDGARALFPEPTVGS